MQEQIYIVIGNSDGDPLLEVVTKTEIESRINNDYYGHEAEYLTKVPDLIIAAWPSHSVLIVRASAFVVPRDEVATRRVVD